MHQYQPNQTPSCQINEPDDNCSDIHLDSDDEEASYLDEAQLDILCRPNIVAADDIKLLITLFNRLNSNDADATCELLELKNKNSEAKREVYQEGIREKLGILLYKHFEIEEPELPSSNTKPFYMEFIRKNLPNITVIELEKGNEDTIEYDCIVTILPIRLIENGEIVNLHIAGGLVDTKFE